MATLQKESLTRRTFVKLAAAAGALGLASSVTDHSALAAEPATTAASDVIKRVRTCCRACGKMECGVFVTVKNGRAIKVEGDESNYHSEGNCCIKSQSSMQACYHPDRLRYPMKRTNPKGSDDSGWVRISWDEAFEIFGKSTHEVCDKYGYETYVPQMGTSRFWAIVPGSFSPANNSPKIGAAQVCKGPRRFVGHLCLENGAYFNATIDRPLVYLQWGTDQTQSNYDDACRVTNEAAQRAKIFISVDPRVSNCGKEADYHLALTPGTDGALALSWCHIVIRDELYDDLLVRRWSNAPFLICDEIEPTGWDGVKYNQSKFFPVRTRLLKESDLVEGGDVHKFMVWDELHDRLTWFNADENSEGAGMWEGQTEHNLPTTGWNYERGGWVPDPQPFPVDIYPALWTPEGGFPVTLKDGREVRVRTVWQKWWDEEVKDMTPAKAAQICNLDEKLIEDACHAWAVRIDPRRGNGGCNFQLAPEQTGNCTMNFRVLYTLFFITGNYDVPAGNRGMTRCAISWSTVRPSGTAGIYPKDAIGASGKTNMEKTAHQPGVKEFPMLGWHNGIKDAHYIYMAMKEGKPYPCRALTQTGAGMQQQCDTSYVYEAVKGLDFMTSIDLWHTPGGELADLVLPAQHWMEVVSWVRSAQGANGALGLTQQCIEPVGDTKSEYQIVSHMAATWGQPWFKDGALDRPDYEIQDFNVKKEGWKDWQEILDYFNEHSWINIKEQNIKTWGTYRRYEMGYMRQGSGNQSSGDNDWVPGMPTPTMKMELWSTIAESVMGDPIMPGYEAPPLSYENHPEFKDEYPIILTTGGRATPFFHNEHRQLPWCREVWPTPRIEINPDDAKKYGIQQGDWVWMESTTGKKIRMTADVTYSLRPGVAHANHQWWYPELPEASHGWNLSDVNYLVDRWAQDRYVGSSQLRAYPIKIYKATPENSPFGNPVPCGVDGTQVIQSADDPRLKAWAEKIERIAANPAEWEVIGDREVK
ncbi:MAG: molybdopterin-dependent oxidoreductase [Eggerthellaceae bacterium]|nr:molybdopterin-dependent oxidoreductase [Eggerthellaceae bacterium]